MYKYLFLLLFTLSMGISSETNIFNSSQLPLKGTETMPISKTVFNQ